MKLFKSRQNSVDRSHNRDDRYADEVYVHSNNSDDSFELMPTLAMGFENSINKKLKNSELRITGEGYFIERIEGDSDSGSDSSDNEGEEGKELVAGTGDGLRKWKRYEGRDGRDRSDDRTRSDGLVAELRQQPADEEFVLSQSESQEPGPAAGFGRVQQQPLRPVEEAPAPGAPGVEQQPAKKKKNLFRKLQAAKFIRRRPRGGPNGTAGASTGTLHRLHKDDSDVLIDFTEHSTPDDSVSQADFSENALGAVGSLSHSKNPANDEHADTAEWSQLGTEESGLAIPVVSQVFAMVDSQENLSLQHKLIIKIAVLLWLLYEINWVLECFKSFFAY